MTQSSIWTALRARSADADLAQDGAIPPDPSPDSKAAPAGPFELPKPDGWTDPLSGTGGPRFWDRIVTSEEARRRRYGRPLTVVMAEFRGFTSDGTWLQTEFALQVFGRVARVLAKQIRTSDHGARIGPSRFGILLIETDEISAINFVDRLRAACKTELGAGSSVEVRTGWASPDEGETLDAAVHRATARLEDRAFQGMP